MENLEESLTAMENLDEFLQIMNDKLTQLERARTCKEFENTEISVIAQVNLVGACGVLMHIALANNDPRVQTLQKRAVDMLKNIGHEVESVLDS